MHSHSTGIPPGLFGDDVERECGRIRMMRARERKTGMKHPGERYFVFSVLRTDGITFTNTEVFSDDFVSALLFFFFFLSLRQSIISRHIRSVQLVFSISIIRAKPPP